jgi:hypothetical protein
VTPIVSKFAVSKSGPEGHSVRSNCGRIFWITQLPIGHFGRDKLHANRQAKQHPHKPGTVAIRQQRVKLIEIPSPAWFLTFAEAFLLQQHNEHIFPYNLGVHKLILMLCNRSSTLQNVERTRPWVSAHHEWLPLEFVMVHVATDGSISLTRKPFPYSVIHAKLLN